MGSGSYSWGIKGFNTSVCSKTTLIVSSVSEAGMNPPFCKMSTFYKIMAGISKKTFCIMIIKPKLTLPNLTKTTVRNVGQTSVFSI